MTAKALAGRSKAAAAAEKTALRILRLAPRAQPDSLRLDRCRRRHPAPDRGERGRAAQRARDRTAATPRRKLLGRARRAREEAHRHVDGRAIGHERVLQLTDAAEE